ncbi:MAG: DNA-binding protein [Pseudopedobacter saltans]|uniref:DNA-binding protein n=1 Tax=Pseudopedobacter saltans TaxID=151895 RepID=A0A2W5GQH8_9SPHI|nr:MAG: DNA-binding protein [Pseudopedobacter saltans]
MLAQIDAKIASIEEKILHQKEVLTFEEAMTYTGWAKSYLYKLTSSHKIPFYKPNGKTIYFKRKELEEYLLTNRQSTNEELECKAATYVSTSHFKKRRVRA